MIFHITTKENWEKRNKLYFEDSSLKKDGFIHCCEINQIEKVANNLFKERDEILILCIDENLLGDIKVIWEDLYNLNEKYPHIYGPIPLKAIINIFSVKKQINGKFKIEFSEIDR